MWERGKGPLEFWLEGPRLGLFVPYELGVEVGDWIGPVSEPGREPSRDAAGV